MDKGRYTTNALTQHQGELGTLVVHRRLGESFICGGRITVSSDQVNDFGHDDIVVLILESMQHSNKAANFGMDACLGTRASEDVHCRLNIAR